MQENKLDIRNRKIRTGLRKQADVIQREKEKIWARLKYTGNRPLTKEWSTDFTTDLQADYGIDLAKILSTTLSSEILKDPCQPK